MRAEINTLTTLSSYCTICRKLRTNDIPEGLNEAQENIAIQLYELLSEQDQVAQQIFLSTYLNGGLIGLDSFIFKGLYLGLYISDIDLFKSFITHALEKDNEEINQHIATIYFHLDESMGKYFDYFTGYNRSSLKSFEHDTDPDYYFERYCVLHDMFAHWNDIIVPPKQKGIKIPMQHLLYIKKYYDLGLLKEARYLIYLINTYKDKYIIQQENTVSYLCILLHPDEHYDQILTLLIHLFEGIHKKILSNAYLISARDELYAVLKEVLSYMIIYRQIIIDIERKEEGKKIISEKSMGSFDDLKEIITSIIEHFDKTKSYLID